MATGTWKKLLTAVTAAGVLAAVFTGCGNQQEPAKSAAMSGPKDLDTLASQEKGPLIIGTYGGVYDEALQKVIVQKFKDKYHVDVIFDPGYNTSKMIAESGSPSVDLAMQDDITLHQGINSTMEKIDMSLLSHAKELYPEAIDKSGYGVSLLWGRYGIAYRTDLVKEKPTSWNDLWDDQYKGKVTMNKFGASMTLQMLEMSGKLAGGNNQDLSKSLAEIWRTGFSQQGHCRYNRQSDGHAHHRRGCHRPLVGRPYLCLKSRRCSCGLCRPQRGRLRNNYRFCHS
jgi:putative spermidine/putrescine transport system substrate-binding protein